MSTRRLTAIMFAEKVVPQIQGIEALKLLIQSMVAFKKNELKQSDIYIQKLIEDHSEYAPYQLVEAYAYRGDLNQAFEWLAVAYEKHDPGVVVALVDPLSQSLKKDPRWEVFVEQMGY